MYFHNYAVHVGKDRRGRPRDSDIDERVLRVARQHLAERGYEAMSLAAIAEDAGTTRQALYRRWPSKADLATAAIASMSQADERPLGDDPYADLVSELEAFRRGVSRSDGLSMVGTMLHRGTDPELVALYRQRVVTPRRARMREILERGRRAGMLASDADIDLAVTMLTGSWYARALAGDRPARRWPERTATLIWHALGGNATQRSVRVEPDGPENTRVPSPPLR